MSTQYESSFESVNILHENGIDLGKLTASMVAFLECYVELCGRKTAAAEAAGVTRWAHHHWYKENPTYKQAFDLLEPYSKERLLEIATGRAAQGWDEPVFQGMELVGVKRKFSDTLMLALLKAHYPDKFKERSAVEVGNKDGAPFKFDPGREQLSDQALNSLIEAGQRLELKRIEDEQAKLKEKLNAKV